MENIVTSKELERLKSIEAEHDTKGQVHISDFCKLFYESIDSFIKSSTNN